VVYFKRDGFLPDAVTGDDFNNRNRYLIRTQLLAAPTDTLEIRFIADYSNRKEDCCAATVLVRGPTAGIIEGLGGRLGSGGSAGTNTFDRVSATTPGISFQTDVEEFGFSAEANLDLDAFTITSITAYRDFQAIRGQDTDFTSLSILERADGGQFQEFKTFSQELRLNGTALGDRLDYLFGFFYSNEKIRFEDQGRFGRDALRFANCIVANGVVGGANLNFTAPGCINPAVAAASTNATVRLLGGQQPGLGVGGLAAVNIAAGGSPTATLNLTGQNDRHRQTSNNFAFFTHNVFKITDQLSLTLGGRYTRDKKEYSSILESNNTFCTTIAASATFRGLATLPCVFNSQLSGVFSNDRIENRFSGTAVVSFKATDDLLTYASYSRGYKGGGFNLDRSGLALNSTLMGNGTFNLLEPINSTNPNVTRDTLQFEEEVVDAYEVGAKFSNPFISLNIAAFYQKFSNFQLNTFNGINFIVANLPEVVSKGFEIEAFTSPVDNLTLSLGFTLADAKYGDNLVTPLSGGVFDRPSTANPAGGALFRLPGQRITNAPLYTFSGSLGYKLPIGNTFELLFNSDIRYQSDTNSGSDLDIEKVQEGYALVNGRIGIGTQDGKYSAEFFVRNLFDVDTTQVNFDGPLQGSGGREALINTQTFNAFLGDPRTFGVTLRAKF
jgi:iron complex outermembrane recepter protein